MFIYCTAFVCHSPDPSIIYYTYSRVTFSAPGESLANANKLVLFVFARHENLEMVKGDAYSIETFESVLAEKDAVLSCLGSPAVGPFATTTLYSDTVKVIIEGMKKLVQHRDVSSLYKFFYYNNSFTFASDARGSMVISCDLLQNVILVRMEAIETPCGNRSRVRNIVQQKNCSKTIILEINKHIFKQNFTK